MSRTRLTHSRRQVLSAPTAKQNGPASGSSGYSGTPLPKKLGVKERTTLGLLAAPKDFERTLGKLPAGANIRRQPRSACDLIVCFVTSQKQLQQRFNAAVALSRSGLWIAWPKKASGVRSDLTEDVIRALGLSEGWVDYKVCAVDATWSGLKFAKRKPSRSTNADERA
jgi:hypothetical protein